MNAILVMVLALGMSLTSTGLFLGGITTPFWYSVWPSHTENNTLYYSVFLFTSCSHLTGECSDWTVHTNDEESRMMKLGLMSDAYLAITKVFMSLNVIALVENNIILCWFLCKSQTHAWASNAFSCTRSSVIIGSIGTIAFIATKVDDRQRKVTLKGSGISVMLSILAAVLTAVLLYVALSTSALAESESSSTTLLSSAQATSDRIQNRLSFPKDKRPTSPEILHWIQMQKSYDEAMGPRKTILKKLHQLFPITSSTSYFSPKDSSLPSTPLPPSSPPAPAAAAAAGSEPKCPVKPDPVPRKVKLPQEHSGGGKGSTGTRSPESTTFTEVLAMFSEGTISGDTMQTSGKFEGRKAGKKVQATSPAPAAATAPAAKAPAAAATAPAATRKKTKSQTR